MENNTNQPEEVEKTLDGENGRQARYTSRAYLLTEKGKQIASGDIADEKLDSEDHEKTKEEIVHWLAGGALPEDAEDIEEVEEVEGPAES